VSTVFVKLAGELVDVRRPVQARHLYDAVYEIEEQPYAREAEEWEFEPGEKVICELVDSDDGPVLTATRRA
jgi:hypothetical protein